MRKIKIWYHTAMKRMYEFFAKTSLNRRKADEYLPKAFMHAIKAEVIKKGGNERDWKVTFIDE